MNDHVLIIDADPAADAGLRLRLENAGLTVDSAPEGLLAMEKLRDKGYCAVVLDPLIRERLNGYAVLNFIELERPAMLANVFLLTGMSRETIARTAPALARRLFRKPSEGAKLADVLIAHCTPAKVGKTTRRRPVLVVEDDQTTARLTIALLEQLGYHYIWAQNGEIALELLASAEFDAILLDLVLPDIDGFEVLSRLQTNKPHLLRRVIVTTGVPERYLTRLDRAAIAGVVEKPIDAGALERLLAANEPRCTIEGGGEAPQAG